MLIELLFQVLILYLAVGLLAGLAFVLWGLRRIDPAAADSGWGFRLIILPGTAIFWPYLLMRWLRASLPPEEFSSHRRAGRG